MKRQFLYNTFIDELSGSYTGEEIKVIFYRLYEHFTGKDRIHAALHPEESLDEEVSHSLLASIEKLKRRMPVEYITGYVHFDRLKLKVNEHTLIPRPETEELTHLIAENHRNSTALRILDIGTGSGCIALSLAFQLTNAQITAMDISHEALETAADNARHYELDIRFVQDDILSPRHTPRHAWDIIVSNPPYVLHSESEEMSERVLLYEPHSALFVPDEDPLLYYKAIIRYSDNHLKKNGFLYLEINPLSGDTLMDYLSRKDYDAEIKKDFLGRKRFIIARKK